MKVSESEARAIILKVREARYGLRCLLAHGDLCDRSQSVLLCLDIAEMLAADETTHECNEPEEIATLQCLVEALDLFKKTWVARLKRHPEVRRVMMG